VKDTSRREAALLLIGFLFQLFGAAALMLSRSVQFDAWLVDRQTLGILLPLAAWSALAVILHHHLDKRLPERDPLLFPSAMFLCGWGLQILFRLSPAIAYRQTLWLIVADAILLLFLRIPDPVAWLRRYR